MPYLKTIYLRCSLAIILLSTFFAGVAYGYSLQLTDEEQEWLATNPVIRFGFSDSLEPYGILKQDGTSTGIAADHLALLANRLGITINLELAPWPITLKKAQNRQLDGIAAILPAHGKTYDLDTTIPLRFNSTPTAYTLEHSTLDIKTVRDFTGSRVVVIKGMLYAQTFLAPVRDTIKITEVDSSEEAFALLLSKKADIFLGLNQDYYTIAHRFIVGVKPANFFWDSTFYVHMGVRNDKPLLVSILQKANASLTNNEILTILRPWLEIPMGKTPSILTEQEQKLTHQTPPPKDNWTPVIHISFMAFIIVVIMVIWNRRLRREIKARKKAESSLLLAKLTLDSIPLHIFWFDQDFHIAMANKAASDITGLSLAELNDKVAWDLAPHFDIENRHKAWDEVKEKKSVDYHGQLVIKNGDIIPTEETLAYLESAEGEPYVVSIGSDITERNNHEKQLVESETRLKEALIKAKESSRLKSEFLSNMSHEIRTPLNAIIGYSEMLSQGDLPTNKQRYAQTIVKSGKTLITLINDILDLSKMEAGKMTISPMATNPQIFFKDIAKIFEPQLQEKQLELKISIDPNLPQVLMLDEVRLRQVIFNILGNGIKFTPKGYVKLTASYSKTNSTMGTLTIGISDSGIGIPKEDHELIFQSFQQQSGGTNRTYDGTGLGLTLSKRLIELMQGEIQLESAPGKGSCFTLILPNVPISSNIIHQAPAPTQNSSNFPKATILITDDIKTNRDLISAFLQNTPLTTLTASNGKEAIQIAQDKHPDLILMDIKMDIMSGTEAATILRNSPATSSIPIIALSGVDPEPELLELFDDFVHKPFSLQVIRQKIGQYLQVSDTEHAEEASLEPKSKERLPLSLEERNQLHQLISAANKTGSLADSQIIAHNLQQYGERHSNETLKQMSSKLYEHTEQGAIIEIEQLLFLLQQHLQEPV